MSYFNEKDHPRDGKSGRFVVKTGGVDVSSSKKDKKNSGDEPKKQNEELKKQEKSFLKIIGKEEKVKKLKTPTEEELTEVISKVQKKHNTSSTEEKIVPKPDNISKEKELDDKNKEKLKNKSIQELIGMDTSKMSYDEVNDIKNRLKTEAEIVENSKKLKGPKEDITKGKTVSELTKINMNELSKEELDSINNRLSAEETYRNNVKKVKQLEIQPEINNAKAMKEVANAGSSIANDYANIYDTKTKRIGVKKSEKEMKTMSNKELQDYTTRMNLETQYYNARSTQIQRQRSVGRSFIESIGHGFKIVATAAGTYAIVKGIMNE